MLNFFIGVIVGGAIGVAVMCALAMTGTSEVPPYSEKHLKTNPADSEL